MSKVKWLSIPFILLIIVCLLVGLLAYYPPEPRIECNSAEFPAGGPYRKLAHYDEDGYAYPIGNLEIDDKANWSFKLFFGGKWSTSTDISVIRRFQRMKFACTGTDAPTAEWGLAIYRDGVKVYVTDIQDDGIQNQTTGYAFAYNKVDFASFLIQESWITWGVLARELLE